MVHVRSTRIAKCFLFLDWLYFEYRYDMKLSSLSVLSVSSRNRDFTTLLKQYNFVVISGISKDQVCERFSYISYELYKVFFNQ